MTLFPLSALAAILCSSPAAPPGGGEPFAQREFESRLAHLEVAACADLVAVAEESGILWILDARSLEVRRRLDAGGLPLDLAISDDGAWIAARTAERVVLIWSASSDAPTCTLDQEGSVFAFLAGSSRLVLADTEGVVRSVDVASGEPGPVHTFRDARKVEGVEISRDGRVVAYALDDG